MEENDISKAVEINSNHVKVIHLLLLFLFMWQSTSTYLCHPEDNFKTYVVCPSCHKLYAFSECLK